MDEIQAESENMTATGEITEAERIYLSGLWEEYYDLEDQIQDLFDDLSDIDYVENIVKPSRDIPAWKQTTDEILDDERNSIDNSARNWNEQQFLIDGAIPFNIKPPFYKYKDVEYSVADDKKWGNRLLIVTNDDNVIGEFSHGNLGILEVYRNKGIGTAFIKYLLSNDYSINTIGYSPEGYKTVVKAHRKLIKQAKEAGVYDRAIKSGELNNEQVNAILKTISM